MELETDDPVVPAPATDGDRLVSAVSFDASFWTTALGAEVQSAIDEWDARGWIIGREGHLPQDLSISRRAWSELSVARAACSGAAELDELAAHADLMCRLLAVAPGRALITSKTYIGAPAFRFEADITFDAAPRASPAVAVGGASPEHPDAAWLRARISEQPEGGLRPIEAQLEMLGELRRASDALARCEGSFKLAFDDFLSTYEVVEPQRVGLAWQGTREGNRDSYNIVPWFETRDGERQPLPVTGLYARGRVVKLSGQKRVALIDPDMHAVLSRVRKEGLNRTERGALPLMADPARLVPEGVSTDKIDLSEYGSRVLGFVTVACAERAFDIESSGVKWFPEEGPDQPAFLSLKVRALDPESPAVAVDLKTPQEAQQLRDALRAELDKPEPGIIDHGTVRIVPTEALFHAVDVALSEYERSSREREPIEPKALGKRLGVVLKDATAESVAPEQIEEVPWDRLENLLLPGVSLKDHQRAGVEWLWRHHRQGRTGVLLADEMGLGKTLQVACFLALQRVKQEESEKPALIVAPVMLLQNWAEELERFLSPEAFRPLIVLHGDHVRQLKQRDGSLDVGRLNSAALVLTNYDTLDRHQLSLLKVDWRAVVLDEAQNIKNPETFRSKAARALKRDFGICSTGTPVENRLLDLWTLFDFLSPQDPLGTQAEFKSRFEPDGNPQPALVAEALDYPSPTSPLLRRVKDDVLDLKPKSFSVCKAAMTDEQMSLEHQIVRGSGRSDRNTLEILSKLRSLYQHPWLLRANLFGVADDAAPPALATIVEASPKLGLCLNILDEVRSRGEKALIFSPWIKMQQLLAHVLHLRYDLRPRIVNGEANQRKQALSFIREFSDVQGFNVLILSPLAAGAGLNIVAANHVIHYGRWWNPAKEDQATDRAHRIGQERPVTVHYPILHHPGDPAAGFDVGLHNLVERKRELAQNFLSPDADVGVSDIREVFRNANGVAE